MKRKMMASSWWGSLLCWMRRSCDARRDARRRFREVSRIPIQNIARFIMFPLSDSDDSDADGVAVAVVKRQQIGKQHDP